MTATTQLSHILAVEVTGPVKASARDLDLSLAIISELLASSSAFESAKERGAATAGSVESELLVLFPDGGSDCLRCALELWEMIKELPLLSVRIALHRGLVESDANSLKGEGIEALRALLDTGKAGQILVSEEFAESITPDSLPTGQQNVPGQRLVIVGGKSGEIGARLETALLDDGHETSLDPADGEGIAWAKALESQIRSADAVVALISHESAASELLQYQLEIAFDEYRKRGRPFVLPIWLGEAPSEEGKLTGLQRNFRSATWSGEQDTSQVIEEVRSTLAHGQREVEADRLDTTGNATSAGSKFYVRRLADDEFEEALADRESIILVKGPRQIGKTTLLGQGIKLADESGWRCAATDFQMLSSRQLESEQSFYRVVVTTLCRQLDFDYDFDSEWIESLSPILNMDGFMRDLLLASDKPVAWFMDETDRLFSASFGSDFFGLVRAWHNARATDPGGPWDRLTIVIGYATEAHLFIKDLNKSPFNVGRRIDLPMFTLEETLDLNRRYGSPLGETDAVRLHHLLGGQPVLTRRAFDVVSSGNLSAGNLFASADQDDGPFGDHLRRILIAVSQLPTVWNALVQSLASPELTDSEGLHRLIAANILVRKPNGRLELPCELYKLYLARYVEESR